MPSPSRLRRSAPSAEAPPGSSARLGLWVRTHRSALHHSLWLITLATWLCGAYLLSAELPGAAKSGSDLGLYTWGAAGVAFGFVATALDLVGPMTADSGRKRGAPKSRHPRRPAAAASSPVKSGSTSLPWRRPWAGRYLAAYGLGTFVCAFIGGGDAGDALLTVLRGSAVALVSTLIGVLAALLALGFVASAWGVVTFGRQLLTGRSRGDEVPRLSALGPFLAVLGVSLFPGTLVGAAAYDSPRRRDLAPLFGWVRDDVDVVHPTPLLIGQISTWACFGLIGVGALLGMGHARLSQRQGAGRAGVVTRSAVPSPAPAGTADPPNGSRPPAG